MTSARARSASGASAFDREEERKRRLARIVALGLAYLAPQFVYGTNRVTFQVPEVRSLVPDSLPELIWWVAVGVQVYLLKRSARMRAEPAEIFVFDSTQSWSMEVLMFAAGFAVTMSPSIGLLPGLHRQTPAMAQLVLALIALASVLLITVRGTVVIDGGQGQVARFGLLPRVRPFRDVEALGKLEDRRGGPRTFYLTLFFRDGKYWTLKPMHEVDIPPEAARIAATTGLPTRDGAMSSPTR